MTKDLQKQIEELEKIQQSRDAHQVLKQFGKL